MDDHPGTAIAEHLETITSPATTLLRPPPTAPSDIEETLAMLLLQHHLNQPPIEWEPGNDPWPTHPHTTDDTDDTDRTDRTDGTGDIDDDTPPF